MNIVVREVRELLFIGIQQGGREYPPVVGIAISESFGKRVAGDLELCDLK